MKITKQQLKKIVKEELQNTLKEQDTEKYFKVYSMFEDYAEAHDQKMVDAMTFKMSYDAFQKSRSGDKMTEREGALANAFMQRLKKVLEWKKSGGKKPTPETKPTTSPAPEKERAPSRVEKAKAVLPNVVPVKNWNDGTYWYATVKHEESGITATGKAKIRRGNPGAALATAKDRAQRTIAHKLQEK